MRRVGLVVALVLGIGAGCHAQSTKKLEFEVASVKPSPSLTPASACRGGPGTNDPELFTCACTSLAALIMGAYGLNYFQLSAPDWVRDPFATFTISARIPAGATRSDFNFMLQNLLADRFKLVVHRESRETQQYDLVVGKNGPKFKEAAPPGAKKDEDVKRPPARTPVKLADDGYPVLTSGMTIAIVNNRARLHNPQMTMAMLAAVFQTQWDKPVTDATGLTGKYEIALYWDAGATFRLAAPAPGAAPIPAALDPGPTLTEAVKDQLGLRLQLKKGMVEFLVVDHAEKIPTEN